MAIQSFSIDGLHCQGCVDTVTDVISALSEVNSVVVDLHTTGPSTVTVDAARPVGRAEVQSALDAKGNFAVIG
jgi:copper chaperone CopZ